MLDAVKTSDWQQAARDSCRPLCVTVAPPFLHSTKGFLVGQEADEDMHTNSTRPAPRRSRNASAAYAGERENALPTLTDLDTVVTETKRAHTHETTTRERLANTNRYWNGSHRDKTSHTHTHENT